MDKQTYIDNFVISYMSSSMFPRDDRQENGNLYVKHQVEMAFTIAELCWRERERRYNKGEA
jgi:hypothetical protein